MKDVEELITLARRYCQENFSYWANRYSTERTGNDFPYTYSESDYNLFPRYNVLSAILANVETLVDQDFQDLESCKNELKQIGLSAQSIFTTGEQNEIEKNAIDEERKKFVHFIEGVTQNDLLLAEPLPYRRRLKPEEKAQIRKQLFEKWNYDGDYWDPLVDNSPHPIVFVMKANLTDSDYDQIIAFIRANAKSRIFEVTEDGADAEIEFSLFHPDCYETMYFDPTFDWVVYGSHESTITFGGTPLIKFIEELFFDRREKLNKWE